MLFYEFNVGDKTYKLKLNTRSIVNLEKTLGVNPLMIFGTGDRIPPVNEMVAILHASCQAYHHEVSLNEAYNIFDSWLEDGNVITDFIAIILEIYKVSGIIKEDLVDDSKN